uniref:DegT/DnrJ/EryC1/StrS aminotransferase n=1 Tax=uncultured Prochlorococcus marinus clone ASNC1363 TaxID=379364 RepID=Q1PLA5_PROMR|nr:degT/DnrJ/EryC1/StrS aminotransferase [uncultured Prochlorococcus marinus clone ASNC1363]
MDSIKEFIVEHNKSLKEALVVINKNGFGLCFVVKDKKLLGVVTDGDLRRYFLNENELDCKISKVMNKSFIYFHVQTDASIIRDAFRENIKYIPLVNDDFNLVDIASINKTHRIPILEPDLSGNEMNYVKECIKTNWISSQGKYVKKFEEYFSQLHQDRYSVSVSNGTTALHLALSALKIGPGDEVIVPNITFAACANVVIQTGAKPVFCEIDKESWCVSPEEIELLISSKTKAIMVVHLYGQVADVQIIQEICLKNRIYFIEDCAEAIGSSYDGNPVGVFGDIATFSFFGNKTISTGEGGMLLFKDQSLAKKSRILRDHGMNPNIKYWHEIPGYNYRLTNMQAAVGLAQLERFDSIIDKKIIISNWYKEKLGDCKGKIQKPLCLNLVKHSNWLYTVILDESIDKDEVIKNLFGFGIEARRVFYPLNVMPPYSKFRCSKSLVNSKYISDNGLSLPSSVNLQKNDIAYIVRCLKKILSIE